jgi:hypothetical protein
VDEAMCGRVYVPTTSRSRRRAHVRLIDPAGKLVNNKNSGAGQSFAAARRYPEALPDRKGY